MSSSSSSLSFASLSASFSNYALNFVTSFPHLSMVLSFSLHSSSPSLGLERTWSLGKKIGAQGPSSL